MSTLAFDQSPAPSDASIDRLGLALCIALAVHAALILGVSFSREDRSLAPKKLEITLAQFASQQAPEEADFLAQHNQQGSGTLEEKAMLTTRETADFQDNKIREVSEMQQSASSRSEARQTALITTTADSERSTAQVPEDPAQDIKRQGDVQVSQLSQEIASLEAKLDIQRQAYAKRPRVRRLTSVATKQSHDALYLHNWRTKIEAVGNRNYPARAKSQGIFGDLRMMVSLLPNGEVHEVRILQSSGEKILDEAAVRIVHLAAPYDPFPTEMRKQVDLLEIIRTWRFHKNRLTSSS